MYKLLALTCIAFAAIPSLCAPAWSRSMESRDAVIARQDEPAVVSLSTWKVKPPTRPGDEPSRVKIDASGFVIDPSGIIVTNKHVIDGALGFTAIFSNGDHLHARLLVAVEILDLALLKVDVDHPLPALKWGDSDALQVGDPVVTIGNPLGLGISASGGIVSALNRDLRDSPFDSYIQTDASINHGNSGGPLIDRNGDVVGINTALYNPEENGGFIGIGFAIPSNTANFVERLLLDPKHRKPGWLGFTLQDMSQELSRALGVPTTTGAIISALDASGPASAASLRLGDVLEKIDGTPFSDSRAFMRAIVMMPVGEPAHLTVWRDGKQQEVTATVAAWPNYMPHGGMMHAAMAEAMMAKPPDLGMNLAALTEESRKQFGLSPTQTGVVITAVDADCEAKNLGIVPGDVIISVQSEPVTSPADFDRAVQNAHAQRRPYLAVLVQAKQVTRWTALSI
jgi:serine protease Do